MATEKRARQRANRQQKIDQIEKDERRDRMRQFGYIGTIVGVVLVAAIALFVIAGGDDDEAADAGSDDTTESTDDAGSTDDATDSAEDSAEAEEVEAAEPIPCPAADGSSERTVDFPAPPPDCLTEGATYTAVFDTTAGEIVAELDPAQAPLTVNNFVYLARYHYYEGSTFHRVIQDFVIQGGDPTGDPPGTGGPGYTIDEEVPEPGEYQLGSLVMAKRTPPSTTGAQFFIVTGPQGEALPNQYSLFGQVTEGLDVATAIQGVETAGADQPVEDVIINSIEIIEN
ncbi:MAG: peptidylprolyl isomerase [Actinomycetota bacterium]